MSRRVLQTKRLKLRPLEPRDATDIARLISEWQVIRWLTSPPWPYAFSDAEWFVSGDASEGSRAIVLDERLVGVVGLDRHQRTGLRELGYWLGRPFWGQGLMTEAANALVADFFKHAGQELWSGYFPANAASRNVLAKLGFQPSHRETAQSRPLGRPVELQKVILKAADWDAKRLSEPRRPASRLE
jgi:RimJ/RimL family protein N-acetyltransferase